MRRNIVCCVVVAAIGLTVAAAAAWCPEKCAGKNAALSASAGGCIGQCIHPCEPASCDHRCTPRRGQEIRAITVADRTHSGCGKGHGDKDSTKTAGHKPCGGKGAIAVADKGKGDGKADGHKPCHAKGAIVVADKAKSDGKAGCSMPCCAKGATIVADKAKGDGKTAGHKPCHAKGAIAVADKAKGDGTRICPLTGEPLPPGADCPIDLLLASMPVMRYRVGEEETCCGRAAENMAKKAGTSIAYLVGDKVFAQKRDATLELTKVLEAEAEKLRAMQFVADGQSRFCPMEAKEIARKAKTTITYRTGGFDFAKKAQAENAIKLVADAVGKVRMTYRVDGVDYRCDKTAKSKVNGNGKKLTYVVGKEETGCEVSAGLLLAQAKVRAIVEAAASPAS